MSNDWFNEDPDKIADALQTQLAQVDASKQETDRRASMLLDLDLYTGQRNGNLYNLGGMTDGFQSLLAMDQGIEFNLCYSLTNFVLNRICSTKTRAQFVPFGGDHKADRIAKKKTMASDAWAQAENYHGEECFAIRDLLTGTGGVMKLYIEQCRGQQKVRCARFPSWEFLVDAADGVYREPDVLYHQMWMPVEQAAKKFEIPEIELRRYAGATPGITDGGIKYITNREMVRVVDAYALDAEHEYTEDDVNKTAWGKRVVVCGPKATVEPWDYGAFPIVKGVFDEDSVGFWGTSMIKPIRHLQLGIIEWAESANEAHHNSSLQVWQVPNNEAGPQKINNAAVRIERYQNTPSNVINPAAMNGEQYKFYETKKAAAYEILGISPFQAAAVKQPNISSAAGMRESTEMQTDRLARLSQKREDMRVEAAVWWNRLAGEIVRSGDELEYKGVHRGSYRRHKLTPEDFEREEEIRVLPSSIFGNTVSGKLDRATELIDRNFVSQENAIKALDLPDLDPIVDVTLAEVYLRETIVDDILADGKYVTPDTEMDPVAMYEYAKQRYFLVGANKLDYPRKNVGLLKRLVSVMKPRAMKAIAERNAAAAPPAPVPAVPGVPGVPGAEMGPGGTPGMPPAPGGALQ